MQPAAEANRSSAPAWPKWLRVAVGTLVMLLVLVLLWSAARWYVPPIVKRQAESLGSERLGRRVTIAGVEFDPWSLGLTINGLAVAGPPPAAAGAPDEPLLQVGRIRVDAAIESLWRLAPIIDELDVEAPDIRLTRRADGQLDIDDVLDRIAAIPSSETARFAVHNIVVRRGRADFADLPVKATHALRELELAIPFVSSLPSQREVRVEPKLAFTLDGSRFDSSAAATPFNATGGGEARLSLQGIDLTKWLAYAPAGLPAQLQSARLGADLRLAFEQRPQLSLRVSGTVQVDDLKLADAASRQLLDAGSVRVEIDELRPLEGLVRLRRVAVEAPRLLASRDATGKVNLFLEAAATPAGPARAVARLPLPTSAASAASAARAAASAGAPVAARASSAARTASSSAAAAPAPQWKVVLAELALRAGTLDWRDATTTPAAALSLTGFTFDATAIQWPLDAPVVFKGNGELGSKAAGGPGRLAFSGRANAAAATVEATIDALPLGLAAPYLHGVLLPSLAGTLGASVALDWQPDDASGPRWKARVKRIAVDKLALGEPRAPELAADRVELGEAQLDAAARSLHIGRLAVAGPRLHVERDAQQRWSFERWQPVAAGPAASSSSLSSSVPAASARAAKEPAARVPAWSVALDELAIDHGRLGFADHGLPAPVAIDLSELAFDLKSFGLTAERAPFHLGVRVSVPAGPSGKAVGSGFAGSVDARGELGDIRAGLPASARAELLLKDLPLHLLAPYLGDAIRLDVQKAQTGFKGRVAWRAEPAGPRLQLSGDATIDDFRAGSPTADPGAPRRGLAMVRDGTPARPLLNWKSLSLRGIELALAPDTAPQVAVAEAALTDVFARIVLDETGRINLQDVAGPAAPASGAAAASAPAPATAATAGEPAPRVRIGGIAVVNGRVNFSDRFVKPNYSANLSELAGHLGAFSTQVEPGQPPQLAELDLRGRVEGTATLEITGQVNPLAKPLALDIQAKTRDLELPPLSPYAIKYAGYGIERGKMSVDLRYVVKPDGQLSASNKIVLNQLAFGDKVEGAPASLPVKLAVALLADRNGVIDLDLPVSGSINDPQFSIGGLIWKALGNLIVKAVTAPFSLLASALSGGGGSELSRIDFEPGTAVLGAPAREALDKVAKALTDRPALTLTVIGESRLGREREAWKQDRLRQIVRAEKRRQQLAGGAPAAAEITVSEAEYPALLKEVYKRADIVKPKNVIGLAKDLPTSDMESLLVASITVADDAMQQLAVRRAVAVRDYLAAQKLPTGRLFLGAPKTAGDEAGWTPRADLKLATN